MLIIWFIALVAGVVVAGVGSRRAVSAALDCTDALGVSAGLVGVSIMAIGTDLPEIANSIIASLSDHGDVNVGDSTGSALTQVTLVLALLLLASPFVSERVGEDSHVVAAAGGAAVAALVLLAVLISDGWFGRIDGAVLIAGCLAALAWIGHREQGIADRPMVLDDSVVPALLRTLGWLVVVAGAATVLVRSFIELTEAVGVPEFIASAVVLSLGTSLPELVVDWTAIRAGASALAIGNVFGSSLFDATLSVGIGPTVHPTAISSVAVPGSLVVAAAVGLATVLVLTATSRRRLAGSLLATYGVSMIALVVIAR